VAIVNAFRFDDNAGAMVSDEESWYLGRRKTYYVEHLHVVLPDAGKGGSACLAYGGVGDPAFHHEVVTHARRALADREPGTAVEAARRVLAAFQAVSRRIADDRLRFLFGFSADDLNRGRCERDGETVELKNPSILKRARAIVEGKETVAGRGLVPANQACLAGFDAEDGFQMFCIKESDLVLSFNAGGFESLGQGRYAGGMRFGEHLGERTLAARREGVSASTGVRLLLESVLDASERFGQVGGRFRLLLIDGRAERGSRARLLPVEASLVATEIVRAARAGFLPDEEASRLLEAAVLEGGGPEKVEGQLFGAASDATGLDLHLRGYKIRGEGA